MLAAFRHEARAQHGAVPGELPLVGRFLEQHLYAVSGLQVVLEINLPGKHIGEGHRKLDRFACGSDGRNH
jgi:hypothetical protein